MSTLVIDRRGMALDYANECMVMRHPELPTRSVPLRRLQRVLCMHGVGLTSRLMGQCQRFGVDFIVLNARSSERSFAVYAERVRQSQRRLAQYALLQREEDCLRLAKWLVAAKLRNGVRELRDGHDHVAIDSLRRAFAMAMRCASLAELRGHEGHAQRVMFEHWRQRLPAELGFVQRIRRPPPDPMNAVLSLAYTLAHHEAIRQCLAHGLDPWLGIYHMQAPGRQSLACDLIEPLRPRLERWCVAQFVEGPLNRRHFSLRAGQCLLGKAGRQAFYEHWYAQAPALARRLARHARRLAAVVDAGLPELAATGNG